MSLLVGSDTVSSKASHDGGSHFVPADVISASFQQITLKTGFSFVDFFFFFAKYSNCAFSSLNVLVKGFLASGGANLLVLLPVKV